jgi:adenylate kinase
VGIPHINNGEMFRAEVAAESDLGRRVRAILDAGDLVPDELTIEIVRARLGQEDTAAGFVLDGFPRTLAQAEALDRLLEEDLDRGELSVVLNFHVSDEVAIARLTGRATEQARSDDRPEMIKHRLLVYHEKTEPLVGYYRNRGILVGIHADRSIDEVFAEVQQVLETASAR